MMASRDRSLAIPGFPVRGCGGESRRHARRDNGAAMARATRDPSASQGDDRIRVLALLQNSTADGAIKGLNKRALERDIVILESVFGKALRVDRSAKPYACCGWRGPSGRPPAAHGSAGGGLHSARRARWRRLAAFRRRGARNPGARPGFTSEQLAKKAAHSREAQARRLSARRARGAARRCARRCFKAAV